MANQKSVYNRFFRVTAEHWPPFTEISTDSNGKNIAIGPMQNVLDFLSHGMKFEYEIVLSPERVWGIQFPNGSFNGMVGLIERDEADILLGPSILTEQRAQVMDFCFTLDYDPVSILTKRATPVNRLFGFVTPFGYQVWVGVVIGLLLFTYMYYLLTSHEKKNGNSYWLLGDSFFDALQTMAGVETLFDSVANPTRILFASWLFTVLILGSAYEGVLISMLSVPKIDIPINSLQDLVNQREMQWRIEAGGYTYTYFKESTIPAAQTAFHGKLGVTHSCYTNRTSIIAGEYATMCDGPTLKKTMDWDFSTYGTCHLYRAEEPVFIIQMSVAVNRKLNILSEVNDWLSCRAIIADWVAIARILKMFEGGLYNKWLADEYTNASYCLKPPSIQRNKRVALSMESFTGIFLVLVIGNSLAMMTFIVELVMVHYHNKAAFTKIIYND